jgi:hypothetical protein
MLVRESVARVNIFPFSLFEVEVWARDFSFWDQMFSQCVIRTGISR